MGGVFYSVIANRRQPVRGGRTQLLLALVVWPLTMRPLRDGAGVRGEGRNLRVPLLPEVVGWDLALFLRKPGVLCPGFVGM